MSEENVKSEKTDLEHSLDALKELALEATDIVEKIQASGILSLEEDVKTKLASKLGWDEEDFELEEEEPIASEEEEFNIFDDEPVPTEEERTSQSKVNKKLLKEQRKEEKAVRAKEKKEQKQEIKVQKKAEKAEKKKVKKELAKQKKIEKANFGKLREPATNPHISILMPIYNPARQGFKEQLISLNNQDYENMRLIVLNDSSEIVENEDIEKMLSKYITKFPYELHQNENHMGRDKSYEKLTEMAETDLIAYATHRDIWAPDKLKRCLIALEDSGSLMAYSDAAIISEEGEYLADSLRSLDREIVFRTGEELAHHLFVKNCVKLETVLVRTEVAKSVMPVRYGMEFDHHLALMCALQGEITFVGRPLIQKRLHSSLDVSLRKKEKKYDKHSYTVENIDGILNALKWVEKEIECSPSIRSSLELSILWLLARHENMRGNSNKKILEYMFKGSDFGLCTAISEIVMAKLPEGLFEQVYRKMDKGSSLKVPLKIRIKKRLSLWKG